MNNVPYRRCGYLLSRIALKGDEYFDGDGHDMLTCFNAEKLLGFHLCRRDKQYEEMCGDARVLHSVAGSHSRSLMR